MPAAAAGASRSGGAAATTGTAQPPPNRSNKSSVGARTQGIVMAAGALSGVVEGLSIQPLELAKTRAQIHDGPRPLRLAETLRAIVRGDGGATPGGLRQLYRGALPEIVGLAPRASAALTTLEMAQRAFRGRDPAGRLSAAGAHAAGALSGASEGVAFAPFQVVKVRMMAREHLGRYRSSWDCLRQILRDEGARALATGLAPTLWRNCIWNSIYYGTVHRLEQAFDARDAAAMQEEQEKRRRRRREGGGGGGGESESASGGGAPSAAFKTARQLACGFGVGVFATCFNAPFDVVKSRFQAQLPPATAAGAAAASAEAAAASGGQSAAPPPTRRRYERVFPTLATIAREEGWRALYRGFVPKALRLGIGQTVGLAAFQGVLDLAGVRERDAAAAGAAGNEEDEAAAAVLAEGRRLEAEAAAEIAAGG